MTAKFQKQQRYRKLTQKLQQSFDSRVAGRNPKTMTCFKKYVLLSVALIMDPAESPEVFTNHFLFFPTCVAVEFELSVSEDLATSLSKSSFRDKDLLYVNEAMWSQLNYLHCMQEIHFCHVVNELKLKEIVPEYNTDKDVRFFTLRNFWCLDFGLTEVSARCEVRVADYGRIYHFVEIEDEPDAWIFRDEEYAIYRTWIPPAVRTWPGFKAAMDIYFGSRMQAGKETTALPQGGAAEPAASAQSDHTPAFRQQGAHSPPSSPSSTANVVPQLTSADTTPRQQAEHSSVTPGSPTLSVSSLRAELESFRSGVELVQSRLTFIHATVTALQSSMQSLLTELNSVSG